MPTRLCHAGVSDIHMAVCIFTGLDVLLNPSLVLEYGQDH